MHLVYTIFLKDYFHQHAAAQFIKRLDTNVFDEVKILLYNFAQDLYIMLA